MSKKERIDKLIVDKGFIPSRERAQAIVMAGKVLVNELKVEKPGHKFDPSCTIRIIGMDQPYVSRGGLKLAKAIDTFSIEVTNRIAIDIGASTGGFTDCLLQHGAAFVFAIDSGVHQLDWKLANNPHVNSIEQCNFRYLPFETIGTFVDIIVIDVSFISLTKILVNCSTFLKRGGDLVGLIKPQFEAGRDLVQKGGVIKSASVHRSVIDNIKQFAQSLGFAMKAITDSPISGKKSGNQEFLIHLVKH